MSTATIIPQNAPACADHDAVDLMWEIFGSEYGVTLDDAWARAVEQQGELLTYAREWDAEVADLRQRHERTKEENIMETVEIRRAEERRDGWTGTSYSIGRVALDVDDDGTAVLVIGSKHVRLRDPDDWRMARDLHTLLSNPGVATQLATH